MNLLATKTRYTPEDLLAIPDSDRFELVDGKLVERDMGSESSWVAGELFFRLRAFCGEWKLGWVWPADNGYQCFPGSPNTVRKPDVSFISLGRLPGERPSEGWEQIPPDLAVEVLSPNELASKINRKVQEYRRANVRLVWIIDPDTRTARIHRPDRSATDLEVDDELTGEDVLPGFRCLLRELFPAPRRTPEEHQA